MKTLTDLSEHRDTFRSAFNFQSFNPEKMGDRRLAWAEAELSSDLAMFSTPEEKQVYRDKFVRRLLDCIGRESRCASSMITGPANFPAAKMEERYRASFRGWEEFGKWRERVAKAVNRVHVLSPEDDLDKAIADYDRAYANHEMMKEANRAIRMAKNEDQKIKAVMLITGLDRAKVEELVSVSHFGGPGFPSFSLTNSRARLKNLEEKIQIMKTRIQRKDEWEPIPFDGGVIDIQNDRVTITHDEKPGPEVIESLKRRGFRWSRNYGNWSRKHTGQAVHDAKALCGVSK